MVRLAIVGCGYWGPNLLRNLWGLPECEVRVACDSKPERLEHMARLYAGIRTTTEVSDVIGDPEIDAVVVATPVHSHFDLAKELIEAGKHTFVEKPLAASAWEAAELVRLSEERHVVLMVGHTFVYSPPVRRMKELIDSGNIGEVLYISSRRLNLGLFQPDINVAWDLGPHDISIILYLLGSDPCTVSCQGVDHFNTGIEDVTTMSLVFPRGEFVNIQNSWLDPRKTREMTIVGTDKMIVYDDTEPLEKVRIYDKHVCVPPHYDTYAEFHFSYHYGDIAIPYIQMVEPLKVEAQHFLDCISGGSTCMSSGREGLRVVEILERATESLRADGALIPLNSGVTREEQVRV